MLVVLCVRGEDVEGIEAIVADVESREKELMEEEAVSREAAVILLYASGARFEVTRWNLRASGASTDMAAATAAEFRGLGLGLGFGLKWKYAIEG